MNSLKRILFIRQGRRSFFDADLEILRQAFEVEDFDNYPASIGKWPPLFRAILKCDLIYIWFMGRHALFPLLVGKFLKKKIILVAGGWDAADCPEIDYGLMRASFFKPLLRRLFYFPHLLLAISESNRQDIIKNTGIREEKVKLIYLGFKQTEQLMDYVKKKEVITVGEINRNNLKRKGLEFFVKTAALMPDIVFTLIGKCTEEEAFLHLKNIAPPNVVFRGFVPEEEKNNSLNSGAVYAQFSYHEAFGCAVVESMLHECVPVVSNRYSLPEVVGETGYVVPYNDFKAAVTAINSALDNRELGKHARLSISKRFSFNERMEKLIRSIETIIGQV